jgi:hypothetical protein
MGPRGQQPPDQDTARSAIALGSPAGEGTIRRRRWLYTTTSTVLAAIMAVGLLDAAGVADVYGVDSTWVEAEGGGYALRVHHGTVSRPGLATPFEIVVERPGGFEGPLEVAIDRRYLHIWDENGSNPSPVVESTEDDWLVWTFEPPRGDTFSYSFDGRIEPAAQTGRSASVAVLEDGLAVVQVDFTTRVLP